MTEPLLAWIPCLDLSAEPWDRYAENRAALFVRAHRGRGHVVISHFPPTLPALPDCAARAPSASGAWQSAPGDFRLEQGADILQVSVHAVDAATFSGLNPPYSLAQVPQGQAVRLIVYRRPSTSLSAFIRSVASLKNAYPGFSVWVDQPSAGWDALSYLLAQWPDLQALHIGDAEVSRLGDIARLLHRPVYLQDFGTQTPVLLPPLPEYPALPSPTWDMASLPIYPGYL